MAASTDVESWRHARILLHFNNVNVRNSWFLLIHSEQQTICDVCKEIVKRHKLRRDVSLYLKDAWLPPWEKSQVLKDDDCVAVRLDDHDGTLTCDVTNDGDTESVSAKKRRKTDNDGSYQTDDIGEVSKSSHKVKKKKKDKADKLADTMPTTSAEVGADVDTHKTGHKRKKVAKEPNAIAVSESDSVVANTTLNATENKDSSISETHVPTDNISIEVTGEEASKKRKRIRKHRPRKKTCTDLDNSSCSDNLNSLVESVGKYNAKPIKQDEVFIGSIPDKLVSPKHYRHGYCNLNVYQPVPNKHQVFKSDSDEESEVKQHTEQYNFLSTSSPKNSNNVCDNAEESMTASSVSDSDQSSSVWQMDVVDSTGDATSVLNSRGERDANKHSYTASRLNKSGENKENMLNEPHDKNTYKLSTASPSVLARQTLPNGVSVFVRSRRDRRNSFPRELSKEEQLNTEATHVSTLFKVPAVPKMTPPRTSQSPRPNHSKAADVDQSGEVSHIQEPSPEPRMLSPSYLTEGDTDSAGTQPMEDSEALIKPETKGIIVAAPTPPPDYTKNAQLKGKPQVGMVIAYRILEISLSCTPEVSAYKEAEVLAVDDKDMVTLKNLLPSAERKFNKFHVEVEDEDEILTNTDQAQEQVTLHVSSLLETRVIKG